MIVLDFGRSKSMPASLSLRMLALLACTTSAFGQAAVEYALKSSGGAVAASSSAAIGGCKVDATLLSCLSRLYPKTTIVVVGLLLLLVLRWLFKWYGSRR